jgi:RNA polymerase sigma-70 factor (ECF subfamily)
MGGSGAKTAGTPVLMLCVIPAELAYLHDVLRRHFAADAALEVVVEERTHLRRVCAERRTDAAVAVAIDRRRIRNRDGRRIAERRVAVVEVDPRTLPAKARRHAAQLRFVERLALSDEQVEDLDTARLVLRIQGGDQDRFALLYLRYFDRVYSYLRILLRDAHEAEDATQQIFMNVLEALPAYERRAKPFRAWLFTIVRNHALNQLRSASRVAVEDPAAVDRRREQNGVENPELLALDWISDAELVMFVERLPLPQRQVLMMRFMLDLSTAEIAEILGRTPIDVRKLQHRALTFLRERLTQVGRTPRRESRRGYCHRPRQAVVLRERRFALLA